MGLFEHDDDDATAAAAAAADAVAHPEPIEIDLGVHQAFEVQMIVTELENEGLKVFFEAEGDLGEAAELYPKQCRILVQPQDEARVREVFTDAGYL